MRIGERWGKGKLTKFSHLYRNKKIVGVQTHAQFPMIINRMAVPIHLRVFLFLTIVRLWATDGQQFDGTNAWFCIRYLLKLCLGVIRPMEDGRYEAYMIPPNVSNHASFLEILPSGDLILAWFSGDGEGTSNCSIVVTKLLEGSELWPEAIAVSWRVGFSNQNPVLFRDSKSGLLYLFHSQQPASGGEELAHIWMLYSADEGVTWSTPTLLFSENGIFDRNRIILSLTGSWVYPMYYSCK